MILKQIKVGPMENFTYIIADEYSREAAIIDAGWEVDEIVKIADKEGFRIKKVILTHSHFDHSQKAYELASRTGAEILFHELESENAMKMLSGAARTRKLKDKDEIKLGKISIKVIHTPGHTEGSICLLAEKSLITGDTLFVGAIGRMDLPGGDQKKMRESLKKLMSLDGKIEVYPGHDYGNTPNSTIGREKENNPYMSQ